MEVMVGLPLVLLGWLLATWRTPWGHCYSFPRWGLILGLVALEAAFLYVGLQAFDEARPAAGDARRPAYGSTLIWNGQEWVR